VCCYLTSVLEDGRSERPFGGHYFTLQLKVRDKLWMMHFKNNGSFYYIFISFHSFFIKLDCSYHL
jgi:hypothetical protein